MNLKTLELFGFKSFMRKLDIHFSDGITVIVGPNGCGKTNVTDALRWVLGEPNARMLRGDRMEDLIFNGTRDYKPLNVAEVSLTVDNSAGILPIEYAEVTVTRRVYRNGESEFLLNRVPGRLKDIHDLFMDTGLGSRAYSVIERDMVEMVLADAPEKRRELLEEAAGIMKYKIRERQARRKLEATDEDLRRLQDVLHEVERQVRALKRQVGAAQRFQEIRDRVRTLEIALAAADVDALNREGERVAASLVESVAEKDGAAGRVAAMDAEIETRRLKAAEADAALADAQRSVDSLAEAARHIESEGLVRRERRESLLELGRRLDEEAHELERRVAAAIARRAELDRELEAHAASLAGKEASLAELERTLSAVESDLAARRASLARARESAEEGARQVGSRRTELANLDAHEAHLADRAAVLDEEARALSESSGLRGRELADAERRAGQTRADLSGLEDAIRAREAQREELDRERDGLREDDARVSLEIEAARSALEVLRALREGHEGFGPGARALLGRGSAASLSDALRVTREDLLPALDAALGAAVEYVVVGGADEAITALRTLRDGEGRATVVDRAAFARAGHEPAPAVPDDPSIVGRARDFLRAPDDLDLVVERLLARSVIVESLEDAVRLAARPDGRGLRFVARSGEWAEHPGVIHGGAARAEDSRILGRADRIASLERRAAELDGRRAEVRAASERAGARREELSAELDRAWAERDAKREALALEERVLERSRAEQGALEERRTAVAEERRALAARRDEIARERAGRLAAVEEAAAAQQQADDECRRREDELVASSEDRERLQQSVHALRLELAGARAERDRVASEIERVEAARRADEEGISRRGEETAATDRQLGELARAIEDGSRELGRLSEELEGGRRARDEVGRGRAAVMEELGALEAERGRWTRLRDDAAQTAHDLEMRAARIDADRREQCGIVEREFAVDLRLPGALEANGSLIGADDETSAAARRERDDLRAQLDRMGAVNLVALDQYEREAKRYDFLKTQHDDLEEARERLRATIRRINRKARALFMETLEKVRANFQHTFGTLFEGGQADVRLIGDEDPLHAPIEIFARPRGKRLSNISLLSSGERALTAVSFLFAIYLVKPSPFCILDEVDAPLDDMNIGRFLAMLRKVSENTQFVMITHNKKTMEIADYLYGVTMEEPGVSKLVSVRLGKAEEAAVRGNGDAAAGEHARDLVLEGTA
ncbi:MAG: chromosome segregation protein SMC [bacterium]